MRLIVARHCQTEWNAKWKIQGQTDIPLDETGHEQARQLSLSVADLCIGRLVCSNLTRAVQTARYVTDVIGVRTLTDARLREMHFGSLEGLHFDEFALKCGVRNLRGVDALLNDFTEFGGETGRAVLGRQLSLLDDLKSSCRGLTTMVVGHGRALRCLMSHLGHPVGFLRHQGTFLEIEY